MTSLRRWWWRTVCRYPWEICDACGKPAARALGTYWVAPNAFWNKIEGDHTGVRCPRCFEADCTAKGIVIGWLAAPMDFIDDVAATYEVTR